MKKIILSATIEPADDSVSADNLIDALRHLGKARILYAAEVGLAAIDTSIPHEEVWVFVSQDEAEPYKHVNAPGECGGVNLSDDELDGLRRRGICVAFVAEYPNGAKYGSPSYASDDDFAAGIVGNHGFRIAPDMFTWHAVDRGDDGSETIWLKLLVPVSMFAC